MRSPMVNLEFTVFRIRTGLVLRAYPHLESIGQGLAVADQ